MAKPFGSTQQLEVLCPACGDVLSAPISISYDNERGSDGLTVALSANVDEKQFNATIREHLYDKHRSELQCTCATRKPGDPLCPKADPHSAAALPPDY